jgi:hypothetical protein
VGCWPENSGFVVDVAQARASLKRRLVLSLNSLNRAEGIKESDIHERFVSGDLVSLRTLSDKPDSGPSSNASCMDEQLCAR